MYFTVFVLFHNAQWLIHRLNQSKYVQTVSRRRQKHTSGYWRCTAKKDRFVLKCREPCRATRFMSRRTFTCILLNYQPAIFAIKIIKSYFVFSLNICRGEVFCFICCICGFWLKRFCNIYARSVAYLSVFRAYITEHYLRMAILML